MERRQADVAGPWLCCNSAGPVFQTLSLDVGSVRDARLCTLKPHACSECACPSSHRRCSPSDRCCFVSPVHPSSILTSCRHPIWQCSAVPAIFPSAVDCRWLQVGNHITDRPSRRVLAPPGGAAQFDSGGCCGCMDPEVSTYPVRTRWGFHTAQRQQERVYTPALDFSDDTACRAPHASISCGPCFCPAGHAAGADRC